MTNDEADDEENAPEGVSRKTIRKRIQRSDGDGPPSPGGEEPTGVGRTYDQIIVNIDNTKTQHREIMKENIGVPQFPSHGNLKAYETMVGRRMHLASGYDDKEEMIFT